MRPRLSSTALHASSSPERPLTRDQMMHKLAERVRWRPPRCPWNDVTYEEKLFGRTPWSPTNRRTLERVPSPSFSVAAPIRPTQKCYSKVLTTASCGSTAASTGGRASATRRSLVMRSAAVRASSERRSTRVCLWQHCHLQCTTQSLPVFSIAGESRSNGRWKRTF